MAVMTSPLAEISWPVRTKRLTLRPATEADVDAVWRYRRLEEVGRWLTSAPTERDAFEERFSRPERLAKTLLVELDGVVIGDLMLAIEDAWSQTEVSELARGVQAELGWCLDPGYGGQGYATEAVEELVRLAFEDLGLRRLVANCFADNRQSWLLMERIGMRRELHAVKESLHRSGHWLDGLGYALLAEEWRDR